MSTEPNSDSLMSVQVATETTQSGEYTLMPSRRKITAQKVFFCIGIRANSDFMTRWFSGPEYISTNGFIRTNAFFQLKNHSNIFACGDIAHMAEEKMAERALAHSELVVQHIRRLIKGKELKTKYSPPRIPPVFFLALGPQNAIIMAKWDYVVAGAAPAKAKSAFLTSYATNLRDTHSSAPSTTTDDRWKSDAKLPCPPSLQDHTVAIYDSHTPLGFSFALYLLQHSVSVRAIFPPSSQPKWRRELEHLGATVIESDKAPATSSDVAVCFDSVSAKALISFLKENTDSKTRHLFVLHERNPELVEFVQECRSNFKDEAITITSLCHPPTFELLLSSKSLIQGASASDVLRTQRMLQFTSIERAGVRNLAAGAPWMATDDVVDAAVRFSLVDHTPSDKSYRERCSSILPCIVIEMFELKDQRI